MIAVDRDDPETILIRRQEQAARPKPPRPSHAWPPSDFVWPQSNNTPKSLRPQMRSMVNLTKLAATKPGPRPKSRPGKGHAILGRAINVMILLDPNEILAIQAPDGIPWVQLRIEVAGRTLTADISSKSARRAIAAIREHGIDDVAAIVRGKLVSDRIEECYLAAKPKGGTERRRCDAALSTSPLNLLVRGISR
jgi:hypothetical protein